MCRGSHSRATNTSTCTAQRDVTGVAPARPRRDKDGARRETGAARGGNGARAVLISHGTPLTSDRPSLSSDCECNYSYFRRMLPMHDNVHLIIASSLLWTFSVISTLHNILYKYLRSSYSNNATNIGTCKISYTNFWWRRQHITVLLYSLWV